MRRASHGFSRRHRSLTVITIWPGRFVSASIANSRPSICVPTHRSSCPERRTAHDRYPAPPSRSRRGAVLVRVDPPDVHGFEAVQMTLEQIDLVKRIAARYPTDLAMAYTSADVRRVHRSGKVACLIGIEGGHQINNSLAILRQMYAAGARYMTLTHSSNTDWADSATDNPAHHGMTPFGAEVVREMNRIGMLVDLSHVSEETMKSALADQRGPRHLLAQLGPCLVDHPRNVSDEVLRLVARNGGIVMVNFAPAYVSTARDHWEADRSAEQARYNSPPLTGLYIGQPERAQKALKQWDDRASGAGGDAGTGGGPHRACPPGRRHRPRRSWVRLRRHLGDAARPGGRRSLSCAACRADATRLV